MRLVTPRGAVPRRGSPLWPDFCRAAEDERGNTRAGAPLRILIVEDDYFVGIHAEETLESAGFRVVGIARTATQALALARAERPDLAFMDIRLAQGGDGIDTAVTLLREHGFRSIFVTAHSDPATRARASAAKPLGWVTKPFGPQELVLAVIAALSARDGEAPQT